VYSVYCLCSYRLLQHDLSIVYCREFLVSSSNCICNVLGVFSYLRQSSCCSAIAVIHDISLPQSHSNITTSNIGNVIRTSTFVYGLFVSWFGLRNCECILYRHYLNFCSVNCSFSLNMKHVETSKDWTEPTQIGYCDGVCFVDTDLICA